MRHGGLPDCIVKLLRDLTYNLCGSRPAASVQVHIPSLPPKPLTVELLGLKMVPQCTTATSAKKNPYHHPSVLFMVLFFQACHKDRVCWARGGPGRHRHCKSPSHPHTQLPKLTGLSLPKPSVYLLWQHATHFVISRVEFQALSCISSRRLAGWARRCGITAELGDLP